MTEQELITGNQLRSEINTLNNEITAIDSGNYSIEFWLDDDVEILSLTDEQKTALTTTIRANLAANLVAKQAEFDNL